MTNFPCRRTTNPSTLHQFGKSTVNINASGLALAPVCNRWTFDPLSICVGSGTQ